MKNTYVNKGVHRALVAALLFVAVNCVIPSARAQGGFDADTNDGTSDLPLDGELTIVAAGGFAYIVKKVADKRKKRY